LEATSTAGAGSATLGAAYTDVFTSTHATHTGVLQVEVRAADLTTGYQYVGFRIIANDTGGNEIVSGVIVQGVPRYGQATLA
jgi:nucleoside-triphosphatase THEP1